MTVFVAISLWSASVVLAALSGVFVKMTPAVFDALAIFAMAFSVATYYLDGDVHDWVRRLKASSVRTAALSLDALLAAGLVALANTDGAWLAHIADWPYASIPLLVAPLALVLHVAQLDRAFKSPEAKLPAATPAAT